MRKESRFGLFLAVIGAAYSFGVSGCSDSSSGSSAAVSALTLPDRIEISQVDDEQVEQSLLARATIVDLYSDADTDYTNQEKETWADDTDVLDMVNDILGAVQDTAYENFVNQGPYKALIRPVGENQEAQSGSSATSSTTESLQELYVEVSRASNSAPMIVKIWTEESDGPGGLSMLIRGYFEVTKGVSDDYPYGALEAHFKGTALNSDGTEGDQIFSMAMSVGADSQGQVEVEFVESGSEENFQWIHKAHVLANSDMSEGKAYAYSYEAMQGQSPEESTAYFAFNGDYFKVKEDGDTTVLDKHDFFYKVYRYKLFYAETGEAVTMNSGFPIELPDGSHGYIGYYGLWTPTGVQPENGAVVTRVDTGEEYTLVKVGGKLTLHTRTSTTLGDLIGVEMSKYECGESGCTDYVVVWDGSNFKKIGERNQQTGQVTYYAEADQVTFTFNTWEGAWCEALRAYLRLGTITSPSNDSVVYYHAEETVDPETVSDMTLYYWGFALDAPITQDVIDNADESSYWANPTEKVYTFDASALVLKDSDGDSVLLSSTLDLSGTNYSNGFWMSPLTIDRYTIDNWWEAYEAPTYYTWQTGPNDWNQFASLVDSDGNYVEFSAPMRFTYTHSTDNDLNGVSTHNGKAFNLEYDGFELRIPWEYNEDAGEWRPLFNLKDGTVLTDGTTNYVVKGTEEAVVMQEVSDPSVADDLLIDESITEPDLTYDASKTALVGAVPSNAELKVIKGELIE